MAMLGIHSLVFGGPDIFAQMQRQSGIAVGIFQTRLVSWSLGAESSGAESLVSHEYGNHPSNRPFVDERKWKPKVMEVDWFR